MALPGVYKIFNDRWCKQTVHIYSDPHFGDEELRNSVCGRPDDETQIKMINSKVGKNDTIIFLGDIGNIDCVKRIRGYKVLIAGNHEIGLTHYEEAFDEIYSGALIIGEKLILSHEPIKNIDWAMNLHGHVHDKRAKNDKYHFNCCADAIGYTPINLNKWLKDGYMANIQTIHRATIDKATKRKKGRNSNGKRF